MVQRGNGGLVSHEQRLCLSICHTLIGSLSGVEVGSGVQPHNQGRGLQSRSGSNLTDHFQTEEEVLKFTEVTLQNELLVGFRDCKHDEPIYAVSLEVLQTHAGC